MKTFLLPMGVLFAFAYTVFAVATKVEDGAAALEQQLIAEKSDLAVTETAVVSLRATLKAIEANSDQKVKFLNNWKKNDPTLDLEEIQSTLDSIFRQEDVTPISTSSASAKMKINDANLPVERYSNTVIGDFRSLVSTIGSVETAFPSGRIAQVQLTKSSAGISGSFTLEVPIYTKIESSKNF